MNRILDNELSQYTTNYLEEHDISKNDVRIIKKYINESKRLINNLKVYYIETKKANKYKVPEHIEKYNSYKEQAISDFDKEIKVLLEMKDYFSIRNTITNLDECSNSSTRNPYRSVTVDILNKESLLLKDYLDNTNNFLEKRPVELNDISYQSYVNDILDIAEENLKSQEEIFYNNYPLLSKNREYVRNVYNASYNGLLNTILSSKIDSDSVKIGLAYEIKSIKKQHKIDTNELVDLYIDQSFKSIDNIEESKMVNFTLFK